MLALLRCALALVVILSASWVARAQEALVLLKRVEIDLGSSIEFIDLSETKGAYRALRIKAVEGRITLADVTIRYLDRTAHSEQRRIVLLAGERTREIHPQNVGRILEEMVLEIEPAPGSKAVLEIYGRQSPEDVLRDRAQERPPPAVSSGRGKKKKAKKGSSRTFSTAPPPTAAPDAAPTAPTGSDQPPPAPAAREAAPPSEQPRSAPPPPEIAAAGGRLPCVEENVCTPVQVFFGTNRERADLPTRVAFSWKDSGGLALGSAVVTVPRQARRDTGAILRPTWWDSYVLRVPPEGDPARHFVIVANRFEIYADEAGFRAAVSRHMADAGDYKDHAFVYVHGYRVGFDDALYRTAQIAYDLGAPRPQDGVIVPFGTAFLYSWPSAGQLKDYAYDQESARLAVQHLKAFLETIIYRSGVKHVHLIAHSMGNVPLLNALGEFIGRDTAGAKVSQVILASPDMGTREFKTLAAQLKPLADGFTLYASASDFALEASRKVHKNEPRAGDVVDGKPIITTGVDTIDISAITTCYFCFGHDEYVQQTELLNDIAQLMRAGLRPPHSRTQSFKLQVETEGPFWRYQR